MKQPIIEALPHAFFATRKGTPIGIPGTWTRHCDECGHGPEHPVHSVPSAEGFRAILRAIEGSDR